jgi:acyl phosphate:glycerol-3-phosphate acyltransferase
MTIATTMFLCALGGYLIGAIPFGYLIGRWRGVNIFEHGSGNLGATNVGRVLGRPFCFLVFGLDFLKGALPTLTAFRLTGNGEVAPELAAIAAGLGAFLGHLFPIYLKFKGGKGVATGAGVVAVLVPTAAVGAVLTWFVVLMLTRYVSVASMCAGLMLYHLHTTMSSQAFTGPGLPLTCFCAVAAALVIVRHHTNLRRLMQGTEGHLRESVTMGKLARIVHVLAVGFWFGGAAFFTFVATPLIFQTFTSMAENHSSTRPEWMPALTRLQASQLAGFAVAPIFPWYFLLQGICGLLALATTFRTGGGKPLSRLEAWRVTVLASGVVTVLIAFPLSQKIDALRAARAHGDEAALAAFASWHLVSLLLNCVTVALAGVALGMAAFLPAAVEHRQDMGDGK